MDIVDFLKQRIAEDEALARADDGPDQPHGRYCGWRLQEGPGFDDDGCQCRYPARVLAECAAKRAIVARHTYEWMGPDDAAGMGCEHDYEEWPCPTISHLAAVYAEDSDYREEWKP